MAGAGWIGRGMQPTWDLELKILRAEVEVGDPKRDTPVLTYPNPCHF